MIEDPFVFFNTPIDLTGSIFTTDPEEFKKELRREIFSKDKSREKNFILLTKDQFNVLAQFLHIKIEDPINFRDGVKVYGYTLVIKNGGE